jgi:hypothetical protein
MTRSSVQIYISLNEVRIFFRSIDEISHISFNMMFILKIYHVELIIIQLPNKQTLFADLLNTVFSDYWSIGTKGCIATIWGEY